MTTTEEMIAKLDTKNGLSNTCRTLCYAGNLFFVGLGASTESAGGIICLITFCVTVYVIITRVYKGIAWGNELTFDEVPAVLMLALIGSLQDALEEYKTIMPKKEEKREDVI